MHLLIDLGNTRLKWALAEQDELQISSSPVAYEQDNLSDLLTEHWSSLAQPQSIWLATQAPQAISSQLKAWCQQHWPNSAIKQVTSQSQFQTIKNAYSQPHTLGIDRWLGLIAARKLHPQQSLAIISCGTGMTVDILNAENQHLGGWITPGFALIQDSLYQLLQQQHRTQLQLQVTSNMKLGASTEDCINYGAHHLLIAYVSYLIDFVKDNIDSNTLFLLSGGYANSLQQCLPPKLCQQLHYQPHLILQGLTELMNNHE